MTFKLDFYTIGTNIKRRSQWTIEKLSLSGNSFCIFPMYIFWNQYLHFQFSKIWWSPTFIKAKLQDAENTRILRFFFMILGEEVLLGTLITMVPTVFEKNDFKGYLSHSQISKYFMLFLDSETSPWTQFLWKGLIFDTQHDALKVLRKFENFGKSRNNIWVPPKTRTVRGRSEWDFAK